MKKVIFISALAIAAAVSCNKSEIVDTKFNEQISFETYTGRDAMTKATPYGQNVLPETVGLYGFYTGADTWGPTTKANLWANEKLTNGANGWTYTNTKYWTNAEDQYTFFAYAPYADGTEIVATSGEGTVDPTITYTVSETITDQEDILYANDETHTDMTKPEGDNPVTLKFKHALSRITVKAVEDEATYDYKVYGVSLSGVFNTKGTLKLSDNTWAVEDADKKSQNYVFLANSDAAAGVAVPTVTTENAYGYDFAGEDNYLMIIPATFTETAPVTLSVVYTTIFDGHESTKMTKTLAIAQEFVQGTAYSFNLKFAPNTDNPITFDVEVADWGTEEAVLESDGENRNDNPENDPWK